MQAMLLFSAVLASLIVTVMAVPAPTPTLNINTTFGLEAIGARHPDDQNICTTKNPALMDAIHKFCRGPYDGHNGFYTPSGWAHDRMYSDPSFDNNPRQWGVMLHNYCADMTPQYTPPPRTFVTKEICHDRFWDLCAGGDSNGGNYGSYDCYLWIIPPDNGEGGLNWYAYQWSRAH